jgi:hypothetical protein
MLVTENDKTKNNLLNATETITNSTIKGVGFHVWTFRASRHVDFLDRRQTSFKTTT